MEAGVIHDFWEIRDPRGGVIDLRVQYQTAIPLRAKSEQKIYSAPNPDFFRIYRLDTATDMPKSIPARVSKVQNYSLRVTVPEMSRLFDGTEQLVAMLAQPLYLRQIFFAVKNLTPMSLVGIMNANA